jgi:2-keto-4-pentenoate hydratase/2-oxohepta-3-ene-1,7-dioic acid hydratase in catechol pathway
MRQMRVARFEFEGREQLGVVEDQDVRPLPAEATLVEALTAPAPPEPTGPAIPLSNVRLRAPLDPPSIRDFSAFEQHIEGVVLNIGPDAAVPDGWYDVPGFYFSNPHAVIGPDDAVEIPPGTQALDFELEVAVVIGKPGRNLTPDAAGDHIAGFTLLNDWSARDIGFREAALPFGQAKGKDFASTLGPWVVSTDTLEAFRRGDRIDIALTASLNGTALGVDSLANLAWSIEELIAYASRGAWIRPGDVIGVGTCGFGCLAELWGRNGKQQPSPLAAGDVVTITAEGIGSVTNTVVEGVSPIALPRAARRERVMR